MWPCRKPPVPQQAEKQGLNSETLSWHQMQVDVNRFSYMCVNKWENEETELVDSDSSLFPLRGFSYTEIVQSGTPLNITPPLGSAAVERFSSLRHNLSLLF